VRWLYSEDGRSSHLLSSSERKYWKEVSEEEVPQEMLVRWERKKDIVLIEVRNWKTAVRKGDRV